MSSPPDALMARSIENSQTDSVSFTLQVVSPSVGVSAPLSFSRLAATTTVKQLKEKIREALPSTPSDENQRLIHRGRLLARDTETMAEVFGQETLKSSDLQTLHLVLRPVTSDIPAPPAIPRHASPLVGPRPPGPYFQGHPVSPAVLQPLHPPGVPPTPPAAPGLSALHEHHQALHNQQQQQAAQAHAMNQLHRQNQALQQQLLPSVQRLQEQIQGQQRLHQELLAQHQQRSHGSPRTGSPFQPAQFPQFPTQPQVPAPPQSFQNIVGQYQRDRAAMGFPGAQQGLGNSSQIRSQSPSASRSFRQEGVGPNGERWQVTVNQTTTYLPADPTHPFGLGQGQRQSPLPVQRPTVRDVQNVLRSGDLQNAQQSHQTSAVPSRPSTPMATSSVNDTHRQPSSDSRSDAVPPIPTSTTSSPASSEQPHPTLPAATASASSATSAPMVYILSSPSGPRALLINGSESFFTPQQPRSVRIGSPAVQNYLQNQGDPTHGAPEMRNRREGRAQRHARRAAAAEAEVAAAAARAPGIENPARVQNNMGAQMLPHLWLLIRLTVFVWFFVSGDSTWYRWISVIGIAVVVFLVNTGILNGIAEDIWGPIRRHLEGLLPLAAPDRPGVPRPGDPPAVAGRGVDGAQPEPNAPGQTTPPGPQGEPDPAEAATRLVEQRRQANGSWVMGQIRRVEHGLILFLASLVPGVGERHIVARAAEDNMILEARRAARAAAEAEAEAVAAETAARDSAEEQQSNENGEGDQEVSGSSQPEIENAPAGGDENGAERIAPAQPALIDV